MKINNVNELKDYILNISPYYNGNKKNWNLENTDFLNKIFINLEIKEYTKTKLDKKLRNIIGSFSSKNKCSTISLDYLLTIGWNEEESKLLISQKQKERSIRCIEYWIKNGYTEEESLEKIKEAQANSGKKAWEDSIKMKNNSPMFKEYWENIGYSKEDALRKRNPSCRDYFKYNSDKDYEEKIIRMSEQTKALWQDDNFINKQRYESRPISQEEIDFFTLITNDITDIKHKPFGINVKNFSDNKKYFVCDGYIKIDEGIIIFEYDGTYWHNLEEDNLKDNLIFKAREDIIGIIRITDSYYKQNKKNKNNIIKEINEAINKIKSKECKKIRL